jgi:hypothetical protein
VADCTTLLGSGSRLYRSLECPASVHLPQTPKPKAVEDAGNRGTAIHLFAQLSPEGRGKAMEEAATLARTLGVPDHKWRPTCEGMNLDDLPYKRTPPYRREMAFAHHGISGDVRELLCEDGHRDYGDLELEETPLTMDVVIVGHHFAEVRDLKTGRTPVPPPAVNPQLLHGALCVSRTVATKAEKFALGIDTVLPSGEIVPDTAVVDLWDLEEHEARIRVAQRVALRVVQAIEAGEAPEVRPGPWCQYCDAKAACPAR